MERVPNLLTEEVSAPKEGFFVYWDAVEIIHRFTVIALLEV